MTLQHPGALTESDLLSWNWSSHGDSSLTPGDNLSLANDYCEIIKQITECEYDSGKDSDSVHEKADFIEVCEEETQVGQSLLHIPKEETMETRSMVLEDEKSFSEFNPEEKKGDIDEDQEQFESDFKDYLSKKEYDSNSDDDTVHNSKDTAEIIDHEDDQDIYNEKDRMLSDLSVMTNDKLEEKDDTVDGSKDEKDSGSVKKEKIDPPIGEAIISGPLHVCLNLGSQWKRRYLTVVDDCLYIWTSYKYVKTRLFVRKANIEYFLFCHV